MACTPATFKVRFPEFSGENDARIQLFLDDAALLMGSEARWCSGLYNVAQCYYAAHLLALAQLSADGDSGVVGPVSKQEVDDVIIEQAVSAASAGEGTLGTTTYGKQYLQYRKVCFGAYIIGV